MADHGGPSPIRAVLLDIDDTLVDTRGAFRAAIADLTHRYLPASTDVDQALQFWRADRHRWYEAYTKGEMSYSEQRHRRANDLHSEFGGPSLDEEAFREWDALYEAVFRAAWRAKEDVHEFLDALDRLSIPYGAVSNADSDYQTLKLEISGLQRVRMLVGVDTFGVGKPDPRVFYEGCRLLGAEPADTAYVGDDWEADALGALDAGLISVWLDRPDFRRVDLSDEDLDVDGLITVADIHGAAQVIEATHDAAPTP